MPMHPVFPPNAPPALAPYSPGARGIGEALYVSGTLAIGADGKPVHAGDATAQTRHVLETIKSVVEAAGGTMADIAWNMIFLADLADYAAFNAVYATYFPGDKPARFCIQCGLVRPEFLVEVASIAHLAPPGAPS